MVGRAQKTAGSVIVLFDECPHRLLVERMRGACDGVGVLDDEADHLLAVRPVDLGAVGRVLHIGLGRPRQMRCIDPHRRTADHRQCDDTRGVSQRQPLRDHAAHRHPHHMRLPDAVAVEDAHGIVRHVIECIRRLARRIFGRQAGVAVVVADHETAFAGEFFAKRLRPPQHRGHGAHDQQHGWIPGVAKRLGDDFGCRGLCHGNLLA